MSAAALHASAFYAEVAVQGSVFTLLEDDSFPVLRMSGGEVVPFWSSRSRAERVRQQHAKYAKYEVEEIALAEEERIRVGVNWSSPRLTGYDVSASDVRANIEHHMKHEG